MKKWVKFLALVMAVVTAVTVLLGCSANGKSIMNETYSKYDNLAANAKYIKSDGKIRKSFKLKGKMEENNFITVDLNKTTDFNTVVLQERGKKVTLFQIYGSNDKDKDYKFLYQSDCIEGGHTCFLGDVSYRYLRIFVNQSSGRYRLYNIGVYNIKSKNANKMRVNSYLVANEVNEKTDFSMVDALTDIIVFGTAKYTKDGNIIYVDNEGKEIDKSVYAEKINIIKKKTEGKNINLICDIAMPYNDNNADIISMLSDSNVDKLVSNIKAFVTEYGSDGYDMDYEFPNSKNEWKMFNNFLRKLDAAIPDKIISLAVAPWDLQFDDDVIPIIDRAEVMLYDMFTAHGYHSIFPVTVNGIKKMLKGGFKAEQLDLGVPFYSRPTNKLAYWGNYNQFEGKLDRYTNLIYFNDFDHDGNPMTAPQYINSVQMISDKTAFVADAGLGGIMIWHMTCDLPYNNKLSLFKAISDTKSEKQM